MAHKNLQEALTSTAKRMNEFGGTKKRAFKVYVPKSFKKETIKDDIFTFYIIPTKRVPEKKEEGNVFSAEIFVVPKN